MDKLSPLAWAAIGILLLVIVSINVAMVMLMRAKDPQKLNQILRPRSGISHEKAEKFVHVLRNPYEEDQKQIEELSHLVEKLKNPLSTPKK